jgi:hypothetical protein
LAAPVQLSLHVVAAAPVVGSGTMTSLSLTGATTGDSNSAPYVDYTTDTAYVGSNNGRLYKVTNVFCQTIASPAANSTCATAPPALDLTWGATGVLVATGSTTGLTSPVVDTYLATPLVFVGGSSGNGSSTKGTVFARIAATGAAAGTPTISVGRAASASGGVVDPPVIDVTNHELYVATGCDATNTSAVAVQNTYTSAGFGTSVTANIGQNTNTIVCPTTNMHAPTPDDAYITAIHDGTTTFAGNMIFCGVVQATGANYQAMLYKFPVTNGTMSGVASATSGSGLGDGFGVTAADAECSSITDVFNSNFASPQERIYMGIGGTLDGHLRSFDAAFATPAASTPQTFTAPWTALNSVITLNITNPAVAPGSYVTVAGTSGNGTGTDCNTNANGTFEVLTRTATQITFNKPAVTTSPCTGSAAGTATGDSTIQSVSIVDVTAPLVARATSGIIIDNVAATGSFPETSNIYFTQLGPGNIAGGSCPAATATISTATRGGGTATINTTAAHGLAVGDTVTIAGVSVNAYNGVFAVTSVTPPTTFTYALGGTTSGVGGSVFTQTCFYKLSQAGLQ